MKIYKIYSGKLKLQTSPITLDRYFRCSVCGKPCINPLVEYRVKVIK